MNHIVRPGDDASGASRSQIADAYKRDFWVQENLKHVPAHHRLQKVAKVVNGTARGRECDLLDVGCGPATLMRLLDRNIRYHGIDIAIHSAGPNLVETDLSENPVDFDGRKFDVVVAQGFFEYIGALQDQKFGEIASLLHPDGRFIVTYTNFAHHRAYVFEAFSNVRPIPSFRTGLERYFKVIEVLPTAYNWHGGQPCGKMLRALNMHLNLNIPLIGPKLAVEYLFVCSPGGQS